MIWPMSSTDVPPTTPSAEVSELLFRLSEKLDKYVEQRSALRPHERTFWKACVEQIDTIASVIAEEDEICDECGKTHATGIDMFCDECRVTVQQEGRA